MSVLVLLLPPRERLGARAGSHDGAAGAALKLPPEWPFVLSADERAVTQQGVAAAALLPRADRVVLVLADADVSWHRIDIPKAPPARLRAALLGVMEDVLLDDDEAVHFALGAGAQPGHGGWVAVTHKPRLAAALAALEAAGVGVERVVAVAEPAAADALARGHFHGVDVGAESAPLLTLARADGVLTVDSSGALARALQPEAERVRWTATPAAAAAAERWLGSPVSLLTDGERALEAVQGAGNLRQFELVARHRGMRALRELGKRALSADWRPVRWGVAALLAVQLLGLNAYAWQQERALQDKRDAMNAVLKTAYPGVKVVLDAPAQMRRETERLRSAAGRPGDADLEVLLAAAAAAWPDGQGPAQTLRFEAGRLTLTAPGFGEPQLAQMQQRLQGSGFAAELAEGRVTLSRATPPRVPA